MMRVKAVEEVRKEVLAAHSARPGHISASQLRRLGYREQHLVTMPSVHVGKATYYSVENLLSAPIEHPDVDAWDWITPVGANPVASAVERYATDVNLYGATHSRQPDRQKSRVEHAEDGRRWVELRCSRGERLANYQLHDSGKWMRLFAL